MEIVSPPTEKPYDKSTGERRGLLIINTGDGKGKSTAAFGLAMRAHGRGKAVKIFQFMISLFKKHWLVDLFIFFHLNFLL
jgi:cob(I)alamin adenosyltransferase